MPDFAFTALASSGDRQTGTLTAGSEREAAQMLDGRGLFPIEIKPTGGGSEGGGGLFGGRVSNRYLATFYGQLADLVQSGVPLLRSLELLERQSSNPRFTSILREVRMKVADGTGLAQAMAAFPSVFSELAVSMVRAGQEGGFLEDVLKRTANFVEHQEDLKSKVIGALAYPVFLAIAGFSVLNVLVIFFVPKFEPIFSKLEAKGELPTLTVYLMGLSHFMQSPIGILSAIGSLVGLFFFWRWTRRGGRFWADGKKLRLPLFGQVFLALSLSRFTRILGTLLHNGIPILKALSIAKDSTGNKVLTAAIEQSAENITAGQKLADPLRRCKYFPPDVVEMIAVGEEANTLEKVLVDIADGLEKRTARNLELMVKLLEPIMLLVMAAIVLVVVAGLLLPVFKMGSAVGG
jgi:general secretion pathway protein F